MHEVTSTPAGRASGWRRAFIAVAVGAAVFAAVLAALVALDSTDGGAQREAAPAQSEAGGVPAQIVTVARLRQIARSSTRPLYWAGARPGTRIEYTQTTDGTTYVRYLTGSAQPRNESAAFVVVATYAQPDAYRRLSQTAAEQGLSVETLPDGGLAAIDPGRPRNAYVVYRGQPYQIEVYAPRPGQARRIVLGGTIGPVA